MVVPLFVTGGCFDFSSDECSQDVPCPAGQICGWFSTCEAGCDVYTKPDCGSGYVCVEAEGFTLADDTCSPGCASDDECPAHSACGFLARAPTDGSPVSKCTPGCREDAECAVGSCKPGLSSDGAVYTQVCTRGDLAAIAVDATSVYYAEGGRHGVLASVPKDGGAATLVATNLNETTAIAVDATSVYFVSGPDPDDTGSTADLMRVPVGGGEPTILSSGIVAQGAVVAVDGTSVYLSTSRALYKGTLMKVPLTGGTAQTLLSGISMALDETNVYVATSNGSSTKDGAIVAVPISGGSPTILASGLSWPSSVAVYGASIYWTSINDFLAPDGTLIGLTVFGVPTTLASGLRDPMDLQARATGLYFWADGALMMLSPGGGSPTTLVPLADSPEAFVVDDTAIYWVTNATTAKEPTHRVVKTPLGGGSSSTLVSVQAASFR